MRLDRAIDTPRLTLRTLMEEDANGPYVSWLQDPDVLHFLEARLARHTQESVARYIDAMNASDHDLLLGIFVRDGGRHIGNVKLGSVDPLYRRGDVGVMIGERDAWGRGYAAEAIDALSAYAGRKLGLHRVFAQCHASNPASIASFRKAGFTEEGRLRDHGLDGERWVDAVVLGRILDNGHKCP